MREYLIRTCAPAVFVVVEVEAPTRALWAAHGVPELRRLDAWIEAAPPRERALAAVLAGLDGDRQRRWPRTLAHEPGGVAEAMVELLCRHVDGAPEEVLRAT
jgi:hypothetical protein